MHPFCFVSVTLLFSISFCTQAARAGKQLTEAETRQAAFEARSKGGQKGGLSGKGKEKGGLGRKGKDVAIYREGAHRACGRGGAERRRCRRCE